MRDLGATPFSYFRMIAYRFGDTPERMQAVLEGTGVSPAASMIRALGSIFPSSCGNSTT